MKESLFFILLLLLLGVGFEIRVRGNFSNVSPVFWTGPDDRLGPQRALGPRLSPENHYFSMFYNIIGVLSCLHLKAQKLKRCSYFCACIVLLV